MHEESLFHAALEKTNPEERQAYLDQACGGDAELRRRVELLLEAYAQGQDKLEPPEHDPIVATPATCDPAAPGPSTQPAADSSLIGTIIAGRYKLLQELGEGGMGTVFVAEQIERLVSAPRQPGNELWQICRNPLLSIACADCQKMVSPAMSLLLPRPLLDPCPQVISSLVGEAEAGEFHFQLG